MTLVTAILVPFVVALIGLAGFLIKDRGDARTAALKLEEERRKEAIRVEDERKRETERQDEARKQEQARHAEELAKANVRIEEANLAEFQAKHKADQDASAKTERIHTTMLEEYRKLLATKDEQQSIADRNAEALRGDLRDLRTRLERLEGKYQESQERATQLAIENAELTAKVGALENEVVELQGVVEKLQTQLRNAGQEPIAVKRSAGRRATDPKPKPAAE